MPQPPPLPYDVTNPPPEWGLTPQDHAVNADGYAQAREVPYEPWPQTAAYPSPAREEGYGPPPLPTQQPPATDLQSWPQDAAQQWLPPPDAYAPAPEVYPAVAAPAGDASLPDPSINVIPERSGGTGAAPRTGRRRKTAAAAISTSTLLDSVPKRMRVQTPVQVDVRLSKPEFQALADGLSGGYVPPQSGLDAPALSVRLRAPEGAFLIDPVSPETQWLSYRRDQVDTDFVSWRWSVTPLKSGRWELVLEVSAHTIGGDGSAQDTKLPDQDMEIRVARHWLRGLGRLMWWMSLVALGAAAVKFGSGLYEPALATLQKLLK